MNLTRRTFIINTINSTIPLLLAPTLISLIGCEKRYERVAVKYDLGDVNTLNAPSQFIRDQALYLFHDTNGWSVMSTRCTYDGCELSTQQDLLICLCCQSEYSIGGENYRGPAKIQLPFYAISYSNSHLYADSGEEVAAAKRFTFPEIETDLAQFNETLMLQGQKNGEMKVPDLLLGQGDGEPGEMFIEKEARSVEPQ